jgi:hypothetical protein
VCALAPKNTPVWQAFLGECVCPSSQKYPWLARIYIFQQARGAIQSKHSFYAFAKYIFQQEGGEASKKMCRIKKEHVQDKKKHVQGQKKHVQDQRKHVHDKKNHVQDLLFQ